MGHPYGAPAGYAPAPVVRRRRKWPWVLLGVSGPLSLILVAFEIFVALLQAFIFAMLTASYIGGVLAEEH